MRTNANTLRDNAAPSRRRAGWATPDTLGVASEGRRDPLSRARASSTIAPAPDRSLAAWTDRPGIEGRDHQTDFSPNRLPNNANGVQWGSQGSTRRRLAVRVAVQ